MHFDNDFVLVILNILHNFILFDFLLFNNLQQDSNFDF